MLRTSSWWRLAAPVALSAVLAFPMAARSQENGNDNNDQEDRQEERSDREDRNDQQAEGEKKDSLSLKAFELENRDPREIQQLIMLQHGQAQPGQAQPGQAQPGQAQPGQPLGAQPAPGTQPRPGIAQQPGAQQAPGLPRTVTGYRGPAQDRISVAIDSQSGVLFVRGTEEQMEKVEKLVEAFDVSNDELEMHQFCDLHLIPIKQQDMARVNSVLSQLQLGHRYVQMGEVRLVVLQDRETDAEQLKDAISKLRGEERSDRESDQPKERDRDQEKDQEKDQDRESDKESDNNDDS